MKIKEAVNIINSTKTARACLEKENIFFYENLVDSSDYFFMMPSKANSWDDVDDDYDALYSIAPKDLARVMDVIQRLLDTPVKERFPEKKYHLRWFDDQSGFENYLDFDSDGDWELWWSKDNALAFTESELEQMKKDNPRLAPAIDAMKEEV